MSLLVITLLVKFKDVNMESQRGIVANTTATAKHSHTARRQKPIGGEQQAFAMQASNTHGSE